MFTYLPFFLSKSATPTTRSEEEIREALQDALRHYEAPGLLPPDSRVDPRLPQREPGSLFSIRSLWKLGWFVAAKCEYLLASSHCVLTWTDRRAPRSDRGPPRCHFPSSLRTQTTNLGHRGEPYTTHHPHRRRRRPALSAGRGVS